jgi:Domain of unknown function (DUF3472)/Domain of unknown function (DUF5077)
MKTNCITGRVLAGAGLLLLLCVPADADEKTPAAACRSVHLFYSAPEGVAFYNEVTVGQSAAGSYFMACGFDVGYFGIQQLVIGKKVVLFSVWDPGKQSDPNQVEQDQRVQTLYHGEGVRVGRFGNEGTGGQSFFDYDWNVGKTYRFYVTARPAGDRPSQERMAFAAFFYVPEQQAWKHLATFSTVSQGRGLRGYYSFIEDFRRNGVSATEARRARFGNGWIRAKDGQWMALTRARFTADGNPALNIDAGVAGDAFFLATGGKTQNRNTRLGKMIDRPPSGIDLPIVTKPEKK